MAKELDSKERLEAIIDLEEPDSVGIHDFSNLNNAKSMGYEMEEVRWDKRKAVRCAVEFNKRSKSDFIFPIFDIPALFMDLGVEVLAPRDNYGSVKQKFFASEEDVDAKWLYDPFDAKEAPYFTQGFVEKIELLKKEMPPDKIASGFSWGIFTMAGELRGTESLLMDLLLNEDLAHKILRKSAEFVRNLEARCIEAGADIAWIPDPTAGESVISTEQYRQFSFDLNKEMISSLKRDYGVPVVMHICGDTTHTMELLPEVGVDVFSVDHIVDIGMTKQKIGDKIAIMGNVHPIQIMWNGTADQVENASRECIAKAAIGGGYILSTGCEIPRDAPIENVEAMARAAERYGRYFHGGYV